MTAVAPELIPISDAISIEGREPEVLTRIYDAEVNLCRLRRCLSPDVMAYSQWVIQNQLLNIRRVVQLATLNDSLQTLLPEQQEKAAFLDDLALTIEMYACLFELEEVGIRLQVLDRAMCPRFHTDKLGCRLVTTYQGAATEWLQDCDLDRSKLGAGNGGLSDDRSGLYRQGADIHQAEAGDLLLLKGDGWYGNEGRGVVHRSPQVSAGEKRLVLTLDFA